MQLFILLFTIFMDSLGFGLIFPLMSPLIMSPDGGILAPEVSLATRGMIIGFLISSFCLGQFFGGPILGALSDRKGRKGILSITILASLCGYLLAAGSILMQSIVLFFLSRLLLGIAAGNFAIAQSIIADQSSAEDKAKNFGLIGMAWGSGFIIGPFIGGKLSNPEFGFSVTTPFWIASLLCLANLAFVFWKLKESLTVRQNTPLNLWAGIQNLRKAYQLPRLRILFLVMFVFSLGWGFFTEFSPLFLIQHFKLSIDEIANFYAYVGLCVALCQGILIRPFLRRFSSERLLTSALIVLGIVLPLMLIVDSFQGLLWVLPFVAFPEALIQPSSAALVSNLSAKEEQGEMLGIHNSIQWAAIGFIPLFSGSLVALYPHLPITVSSVCMFITAVLFLLFFKRPAPSASEES